MSRIFCWFGFHNWSPWQRWQGEYVEYRRCYYCPRRESRKIRVYSGLNHYHLGLSWTKQYAALSASTQSGNPLRMTGVRTMTFAAKRGRQFRPSQLTMSLRRWRNG